jgi:hypothetical protein
MSKMQDDDRNGEPECFGCKHGLDALRAHDEEAFKKCGWYAHYVCGDEDYPFAVNYHTHGFPESFKHKDIQVCLSIPRETIHSIVFTLADRIRAGEVFEAGDQVAKIIGGGYLVTFKDAKEDGRDVLRLIFPDRDGNLSRDDMDDTFAQQWGM